MLHRKKPQIKAVFVDTLESQGTLDTMVHLEETAEMDSEVKKVIRVSFEAKTFTLELHFMPIFPYVLTLSSQFVIFFYESSIKR